MNAPLARKDVAAAAGTLELFALFHLNLAFSSIEEEQRGEVIARCYWPLLRLAEKFGPIGIELTGFTLEEIAARDPAWVEKLRTLLADGRAELIGSGYAQMIGPLVPARVTKANLEIGNDVYARLLGVTPRLALVNEQAYSAGLVGLYLDAGYRALLMDWDNPGAVHPEWPAETRYRPRRALGADGRSIGLVWTNTVAFQKLQALVHRDIEIDAYMDYVRGQQGAERRALCVYASDAEIFDFRPGRYKTEEKISGGEWTRLEEAFAELANEFALVAPSDVLALAPQGEPLRLETAAMPVPVKKQRKYNLARWAVTGPRRHRDQRGLRAHLSRHGRARCRRPRRGKSFARCGRATTAPTSRRKRWDALCARLAAMEKTWSDPLPEPGRAFQRRDRYGTPLRDRHTACDRAAGCPPRAWRWTACVSRAIAPPRWADWRTAISTTSHCRPTGTAATACSRRRASTR